MLLLMIDADLDKARDFSLLCFFPRKEAAKPIVDVRAIAKNALCRGPRKEATLRAGMAGAQRLVIGVEAIVERFVEQLVATEMRLQDEVLEKPRHVSEMPFRRTGIVGGLDGHILGRERRG